MSFAAAQRINLKGGTVAFAPDASAFVAAFDCASSGCLEPVPGSAEVTAKAIRQGRRSLPDLELELGAWSSGAGPELLVRAVIDGVRNPPRTSGWFSLDAPVAFELPDDPVVNVRLEYRLRPRPEAAAGFQRARVLLRLGNFTVEHEVTVGTPPVTALRVVGTGASVAVSVAFDYGTDPLGYLQAVLAGTPLAPTGASLRAVEVYTNDPDGYRVAVAVAPSSAEAPPVERLLLFGARADGTELLGSGPTGGFVPLVEPGDYALRVDGDEPIGASGFDVTFTALPR